jgi:hypothetical protein
VAAGISATVANALLASILNGTAFTAYGPLFVQLHVGSPGSAGTANIAGETLRVTTGSSPFSAPAGGSTTSANAVAWTGVSTTETYTYVTFWSALTGGVFIASGTITSTAVTAGGNFTIPAGDIAVAIPCAA